MGRTRALAVCAAALACLVSAGALSRAPNGARARVGCASTVGRAERLTYEVVHTYPHDPSAFTEGLIADHGVFYESTGLWGHSDVRVVDIPTGRVLRRSTLEDRYFGEGLAALGDRLYQLTYREHTGLVYSLHDLRRVGGFSFPTEGWGLTAYGGRLVMSDGSSTLYTVDPTTSIQAPLALVTEDGAPLAGLNDLQTVDGCIYANVYPTDRIVIIDPASGRVTASLDLGGLRSDPTSPHRDVLNGIAVDPDRHRLFVTGKMWGSVYEIRIRS